MVFYFGRKKIGKLVSIESKSVDIASKGFVHITKAEYDSFIASLPIVISPPPEKPIDPKKLKQILKSKGIISDGSEIE